MHNLKSMAGPLSLAFVGNYKLSAHYFHKAEKVGKRLAKVELVFIA